MRPSPGLPAARRFRPVAWTAAGLALLTLAALLLLRTSSVPDVLHQGRPVTAWALDLNSPVASERAQAAQVITTFRSEAVPPLAALLRTPDSLFTKPLRWLGPRLPKRLRAPVQRWLNPDAPRARRAAAARAFLLMGPQAAEALPALTRALRDESPISWTAALALAQMGEPGIAALTGALETAEPAQRGFVCYALSTQGLASSNAIPALGKLLFSGERGTMENAAKALGAMGRPAVPALIRALVHTNVHVRVSSAQALASMGSIARAALPQLAANSRTDPPHARAAAVDALARIKPGIEPAFSALTNALRDPSLAVRLRAVEGLGRAPETWKQSRDALLAALQDDNAEMRSQVVTLLGAMGDGTPLVITAIAELLTDPNEAVREKARAALENLTP